jgi:hypothetical protein
MASKNIPVSAQPISGIPTAIKELTQRYLELTQEYKRISDELTRIRDAKRGAEQRLIQSITQNGLVGYGITYQGNKLTLAQDTSYDTLTYKFLEECLTKLYSGDLDLAKRVILFIKKQRTPHQVPIIKINGQATHHVRPGTPPIDNI